MSVLPFEDPMRSRSVFPIRRSGLDHGQSPEHQLMAAVLKQALDDLRLVRGYRGKSCLTQVEAWFGAREPGWPFSFENLCVELGLDADLIRGVILPKLQKQ
jgi:hypothetical protein